MREETFGGLKVRLTGGPDRNGGGDGPLVLLMHGFAAPGTDLVPLARVMDVPREVRFAFPEAPLELGPEYAGGRAWWWIDMMRIQVAAMRKQTIDRANEVPEGIADARAKVRAMIEELATPDTKLVIGGFSQGAMLACDVALRTSRPLAGLVVFSGTLIASHEWEPLAPSRAGLRTVVAHGDADPILPFAQAEGLRDFLTRAKLDVRWVPFHGQHEIPPPALDAASKLVRDAMT